MNEWIVNSVPVLLYGYGGCMPFFPPACFLLATNIGPDSPLLRHPGLVSIQHNLSHTLSCKGPKTRLDPLVSEPLLSLQIFPFNLHEFAFSEIGCIFLPGSSLQDLSYHSRSNFARISSSLSIIVFLRDFLCLMRKIRCFSLWSKKSHFKMGQNSA